jgi:hypothetical protein
MNQAELLARLNALTGDLNAGDTGAEDLHLLRRRLAASLRDLPGEAPSQTSLQPEESCLETQLKLAVAESSAEPIPQGSRLFLVRRETPLNLPILASEQDHPLAGQAPARTFGPFFDSLQKTIWFDEFIVGPTLQIGWAGRPDVTFVLPATLVLPGTRRLQYSDCSIWVAASALVHAAPAGAWAGWKVLRAALEFSAAGTVAGQKLTLPANATCQLTMTPDDSEAAAPPPGPGADAANATVVRPDNAELFFNASGVTTIRSASASVSVFGHAASLVRLEDPPIWDEFLGRVLIPFLATPAALSAPIFKSALCGVAGEGSVTAGAWSPIPSRAAPDQLGDAGSGGSLLLTVAGGFQADSAEIQHGPLQLSRSYVYADRGTVGWFAPAAANLTSSAAIALWQHATLHVAFDEVFPFYFLSSRLGLDSVQCRATLAASLDQPRQADGSALPVRFPKTAVVFVQTLTGIAVFGSATDLQQRGRTALALSNGLFTVTPALKFSFNLKLASPEQSASGNVELQLGIYQLLPTLPDPYAANFGPNFQADAPRGRLRLKISWTGDEPQLTFTVETGLTDEGAPELVPQPLPTSLTDAGAEAMRRGFYSFVGSQGKRQRSTPRSLRLLDVSTNSDQLGVNLSFWQGAGGTIQVAGVDLISLGGDVEVLMLPQVQWEPVRVIQNRKVGLLPEELASPDDGGPTLIGARTVRLVPIAPLPITTAVIDAYNRDAQPTAAFFTLPFGIRALAALDPQQPFTGHRPKLGLRHLTFDNAFTSATQVRLAASPAIWGIRARKDRLFVFQQRPPLLPGVAIQLAESSDLFHTPITFPDGTTQPAPYSILNPLDSDFNATFSQGDDAQVPIESIDLSGFGASCFSSWANESGGTGISNVKFEVLNGRTRYEVIRMRSKLIPCDAVVVRTITLERRASGAVYRWDSGWVPVTDGLFEWQGSKVRFHTGAVQGFYNIREIRDTRGTINVGGAEVEVVHFDADIAVDQVVRGATSGNRVPALNQLGFVQRIPLPFPAGGGSPLSVLPLNPDQLRELLEKYGPVGGNVDCMVNIGGSGQQMRVTEIFSDVAPTDGPDVEFAVACYGSLVVPRNEQWSMCRSSFRDGDVVPVDARRGVPLVRRGGSGAIPASGPYRIAEPQDLLTTDPSTVYGIQLTTSTNRLLFLRPEITPGISTITGVDPAVMADPYVLVGMGGPFPPLQRCLHLTPAGYKLDVRSDGYQWTTPAGGMSFNIPDLPSMSRFLLKSGSFDLRVDYVGKLVQIAANSGAPWSINIPKIPAVLDVHTPDLGTDILKVVSDLYSPGALATDAPEILFGGALKTAADIITALQNFLPALDTPPLDISLSVPTPEDPNVHLRIAARFPIANTDGSALDIGIGKFRGELGVGTEIQLGLASFGGRIYFTVQGEIQQPLLPKLLYVGGSLFLEISINESGTPGVRLVTSAVASVGGDLIPGLVALEGSVSYGYFLDTNIDPFMPGVALGMELRAKLLSGLVGVRFRADVAVGVAPIPPIGFARDVLIAGQFTATLSVVAAWVFEKDFSKTLHFQQRVPGLVVGAFAVYTGMVPIPV